MTKLAKEEIEKIRQEYIERGAIILEKGRRKCTGITLRKLSNKDLLGLQAYLDSMEGLTMENGGNPREYFRNMFNKERQYRSYHNKKKVEYTVTFLLGFLFGFFAAFILFGI